MRSLIFPLLLLVGCSAPTHWTTDIMSTGTAAFDSKRLRYLSSQAHPPLQFEIVKIGGQMEAFLNLTHCHFSEKEVKIQFVTQDQTFEDQALAHEGGMRVHLSAETAQKVIQTLQEGQKVVILLDGFEETLDPEQFPSSFSEFAKDGTFFPNLFRGPIE